MTPELTNLLPPERVRSFRRLYFLRLLTVGVALLAGVVLVHGVLLLPSYLYLNQQIAERKELLASLSATLAGSEEREVSARVTQLMEDATYLARLQGAPTASWALRSILEIPRPGISLTGFTFSPAQGEGEARVLLSGTAATRESLRRYDEALGAEPYVTSTNLPISAYAKESDIDFTITLTGSFAP